MNNQAQQIIYPKTGIFDNRYVDHRSFYMALYNAIPSLNYIGPLEGEKAFDKFREQYGDLIENIYTYRWLKLSKGTYQFDRTIVQLKQRLTLEFNTNYCELLHDGGCDSLIAQLTTLFSRFKERKKRAPREINLIVKDVDGLELKAMEIRRSKLDIGLFYEDDFKAIDALIQKRLNHKNDKGIVLLHGLPGTGKTTYLRYLIGRVKKQVLFLSPDVAGSLTDPSFIQLLIDNPNTVLIIEDAEHIIMDRRINGSSSVSSLLNISDGLLADFLNVQLICTFNSAVNTVDSALMRKGRLIARYEFGKLSTAKAQALSNKLGYDRIIEQPMTLAEISNPQEAAFETKERTAIGFRSAVFNN